MASRFSEYDCISDVLSFLDTVQVPHEITLPSNVVEIKDFDQCGSQFLIDDSGRTNWLMLMGEVNSDISSMNLNNKDFDDLDKLRELINRKVYKATLKKRFSSIFNTYPIPIGEDICLLYESRKFGINKWSQYLESLAAIYSNGFIPCGWEGDKPNEQCSNGKWLIFNYLKK